jgi:chloramphenicol 3-O phosphotransferase
VIVLNGGSSSGKSGIARCLQAVLPDPWLALGTDTLVEAAPSSSPTSAAGIEFGPDGGVIVGPEFRALEAAWMTGIAAMAQAGAHIVLDEVFLGGVVSQRRWQNALGPLPVLWVGVRCDREVAAAREIARGDRILGMAASQADLVHEGMVYDVEVDTAQIEALECARIIAAHIDQSCTGGAERGPGRGSAGVFAQWAQGAAGVSAQRAQGGASPGPAGTSARGTQPGRAQGSERGPALGTEGESDQGDERGPGQGVERASAQDAEPGGA